MVEFKLPDVGEGVAEGELIEWHVAVGDRVTEDQVLAEVETDKALVDVPSPVDGTVRELHAEAGEVVPVGNVLVTIETDEEIEAAEVEVEPDETAETATEDATAESTATDGETTGRVFAAPSARRLARELGVDIAAVDGSGPGGRVTEDDVRAAAERAGEPAAEPAEADAAPDTTAEADTVETADASADTTADRGRTLAVPATEQRDGEPYVSEAAVREYAEAQQAAQRADTAELAAEGAAAETGESETAAATAERERREPYRGVRKTIGEHMERAKFTAPHVTHHDRVEVSGLVEAREKLKPRAEEQGIRLTYMPFVVKAVVAALKQHPVLNTQLDEEAEEVVYKNYYNVGVATATDAGLMVPVVEDADRKGLLEIASAVNELVEKARERTIAREEMQGGTFSITNFGAVGGEYATPIVNYPETAILGLGAIQARPWVVDGEVVARKVMTLSLSIDHRVIDGAEAAAFTNTLKEYLSEPTLLLLE
jgi:pyruvate dehydrogenase E2 component (dihydrolipoamide acetyltransferase)